LVLHEHDRESFEALKSAFESGDAALARCTDKDTGEHVAVVCALAWNGSKYCLTPVASLFPFDPFERLMHP